MSDTEMMDWLERHPDIVVRARIIGGPKHLHWTFIHPEDRVVAFPTLREAVTAASKLLGE